jgi:hypothetical protein
MSVERGSMFIGGDPPLSSGDLTFEVHATARCQQPFREAERSIARIIKP